MMKTQVQCANCGLHNKSSHANCIRCYAPFAGGEVTTVPEDPPAAGIPLWVKLTAAGALVVVLLVAASAATLIWTVKQSVARRYARLENAIRISPKFDLPVSVEAGRYAYYDPDTSGTQQEATPAAYTLAQAGLLYVHTRPLLRRLAVL